MRAMIDANVFVSFWTLDVLMSFADEGLLDPHWSEEVEGEYLRACDGFGRGAHARRLLASANRAYPDAKVTGWERHMGAVELPDPDDRHVVAAAIEGGCDAIVTYNLRDFSAEALAPLGLRAMSPDDVAMELAGSSPVATLAVVERLIGSKARPPRSYDQEIEGLRRCGMRGFADWLDS